jgi:hypothetical protein
VKTFKEFLQMRETGDLWATQGQPGDDPRPSSAASRNKDPYNHKFGQSGGMYSGSGPGLGGMQPARMKKMKQK